MVDRLWNGCHFDPHFLIFMPLCNLLYLSMVKTCDLLLTNSIQQGCSNVCQYVYMIVLDKTIISIFLRDSVPCWLWRSKFPCCDLPYEEGYMARNWGQSLDDSQQETEALRLVACNQQNDANNQVILETDPSPFRSQMRQQPPDTLIEALQDP